jgi:hypothetical protein
MTVTARIAGIWRHSRRRVFLRYLLILTAISMVWEFAQMPLYTLAATGTPGEIIYSALHCTLGDALIGGLAFAAALILFGSDQWPVEGRFRVLAATLAFGLGYTIFSEWLNVEVRGAWTYSELMPVVPVIGTGLSPLLQWLILPIVAHLLATRDHFESRRGLA